MIHPNAGNPVLLLILSVIMAYVVYLLFTAKPDDDPLAGDDHSEPF